MIKEKLVAFLKDIEGVIGYGITNTEIYVYLSEKKAEKHIPSEFEGIPIVIQYLGKTRPAA